MDLQSLSTLPLPAQIALMAVLSWMLPLALVPLLRVLERIITAIARVFAKPRPKTKVPELRYGSGGVRRGPGRMPVDGRIDQGFALLGARRIKAAKLTLRGIVSDGILNSRTEDLRVAIRKRERLMARRARGEAA